MYKYDGEPLPPIPPTKPGRNPSNAAKKIRNAHKLLKYLEEGLESSSLPKDQSTGLLDRQAIAREVGFARSSYRTNEHIKSIIEWGEKALEQQPRTPSSGRTTDAERLLKAEVERLRNRNVVLKTDLDDANAKLKKQGYEDKMIENGQARLPW